MHTTNKKSYFLVVVWWFKVCRLLLKLKSVHTAQPITHTIIFNENRWLLSKYIDCLSHISFNSVFAEF